MELEGALLCSQEPATGHSLSPYLFNIFIYCLFNGVVSSSDYTASDLG
jgi:hypothetical protein